MIRSAKDAAEAIRRTEWLPANPIELITLEARHGRGKGRALARAVFRKRGRLKRLGAWRRYWRYCRVRANRGWVVDYAQMLVCQVDSYEPGIKL